MWGNRGREGLMAKNKEQYPPHPTLTRRNQKLCSALCDFGQVT